ncbi:phospholipase D family protein [Ectothiorhodospira haloalkaliphila]|uniref:restriction endonuclease PLD domain-containing protein n=1 Tax=Ectothiorhodospira haloalkaliphila TaxID=421628 RepID=UPI001EE7B60A|nr:phospholipase D family protein [Ectothiorhodospira haloalkaliphila]MCG5526089.1 phospholipase D family protein [Ectothiorhodospira haloalkaliphila]
MFIVQNATEPGNLRNALVDIVAVGVVDIRVASAYVTLSGANILLSAVKDAMGPTSFAAAHKTLVTSFDFGLTEPQALQYWRSLANAEVFVSGAQKLWQGSLIPQRAFHPKLYVFGHDSQTCSTLVGSANLTGRGFSVNTEAAWMQQGVSWADADFAFERTRFNTTPLTDDLLHAYIALREAQPPPPEIAQEAQPVPAPAPVRSDTLPLFRHAIETGLINPAKYTAMWIHGEALQGGSRNQLELPRGGHRFFGFGFAGYNYRHNLTIGEPVLRSGARVWNDRRLTWHGNNKMERMNLPTVAQGGFDYADTAVMFRRLIDGSFELIVTSWDSDLARSWRHASAQRQTLFRLGSIATNRVVGLI